MSDIKNRADEYWICEKCVVTNHPTWKVVDYPITVTVGLCGHCYREDECILIPIRDFIKNEKTPAWD